MHGVHTTMPVPATRRHLIASSDIVCESNQIAQVRQDTHEDRTCSGSTTPMPHLGSQFQDFFAGCRDLPIEILGQITRKSVWIGLPVDFFVHPCGIFPKEGKRQ